MYFLWKRTPLGSIRVSCNGFSDCINRFLSGKARCRSLSVAEGETAAMTLVLSSNAVKAANAANAANAVNNLAADCGAVEKRLAAIVAPLGFSVKVIWADRGTPGAELCETLSSAYQSPWTWMLVATLIALKFTAGWKGFFWTLFWGAAAWFVSKLLIYVLSRR